MINIGCLYRNITRVSRLFDKMICVIFIITLSKNIGNAQNIVSYDDSCVIMNEEKIFRALFLSFGIDSACWILNDNKTTLIKVYVDSLCKVTDVVVVNSVRAKHSTGISVRLLDVMKKNSMTFQKCYETPPLFVDDHVERLRMITEETNAYIVYHYHGKIPISTFVLKSDFIRWVNNISK